MKQYCLSFLSILLVFSCGSGDSNSARDYRQDMRDFVQAISAYAKAKDSSFIIIPQNGQELITENGESDGTPDTTYLSAIDGIGREDLYYGYDYDNVATSQEDTDYMIGFLDVAKDAGKVVMVTDYCSTLSNATDSYDKNFIKGYISYAASSRDLEQITDNEPSSFTNDNITTLAEAENFLYLINPDFISISDYLTEIDNTDYDVLLIDLFYDGTALIQSQITQLKDKSSGGDRLVIAYMSIGEAEDYRYYWDSSWDSSPPSWLAGENPDWPGNYKVRYWMQDWQDIIYGSTGAYLDKIIAAGFDGVYLDIIDAFEYFEGI